jgi:hypothetical protein
MKPTRLRVAAAAVATLALAAEARAAERSTRAAVGTQFNPLGLRVEAEASWRWGLTQSSRTLLKDAHVAFGVTNQLSPAYDRLQAWVELSPLSILDLRASAEGVGYFGTFGNLVGLPSYDSDFSDDARELLEDQAVPRVGRRLALTPVLKLKAGRISLRASADFESWKVHDAPESFFYEPFRGTLLAAGGDSLVNGSNLLLCDVSRGGTERVRVGVFHDYLEVWDAPQNRRQRLGGVTLVRLGERRFGGRDPVLSFALLDYLEAPNRSGLGGFVALSLSRGTNRRP